MSGGRLTSKRVALSAAFLGLAASAAACSVGPSEPDYPDYDDYQPVSQPYTGGGGTTDYTPPVTDEFVFYCGDDDAIIVDDQYCDNTNYDYHGLYFLYFGARWPLTLKPGTPVPSGWDRFDASDEHARSSFGLPATGRVKAGTVRTGVVGGSYSTGSVGG